MTNEPASPIRALPLRHRVDVLTPDQVERVRANALAILERTGVATTSDRLLRLMAEHEQDVDFERQRIRFASDFVEAKQNLAPRTFTLAGRHLDRDLSIDGAHGYLSPDGCAPTILDLETGKRRPSTKQDLGALTRIADALPQIAFTWRCVSATDQPGETHSLHEVEVQFNNTSKHMQTGSGNHGWSSRGVVELCRAVAGGAEELRMRPNLSSIQCIISPLLWDEGPIEAMANYTEAGIPISLTSMAMTCATAPATVAGLVTLTIAELLSGLAILQTMSPGAKAIYAAYPSTIDLHSGALNMAAGPEDWFAAMAVTQVLGSLGLPSQTGMLGTGAKGSNWQAGAQAALTAAKAAFMPADLFSGAGGLYASNVYSGTQLILDCEVFDAVIRFTEGYPFDDEHAGLDVIDQVQPGNHFLGEPHTLEHMNEFWRARFMDSASWEEWEAAGEPDPAEAARAEARRLALEHEPEPLDEDVSRELSRIVASYEAEAILTR